MRIKFSTPVYATNERRKSEVVKNVEDTEWSGCSL